MRPVSTTWTFPKGRIGTVVNRPRSFDDELYARDAPPVAGSEAVNWKKVGNVAGKIAGGVGKVLSFLKREDQELLARAIEDELIAREPLVPGPISFIPMNTGLRWTKGRIGTVVNPPRSFDDDELMARSFDDDELYARSGFVLDELD
ncbi:hypothetical protein IEO21_08344 [Rhodonia placenta]|uniref:Uncharacterized protein n=1 Tax=Rhodonia placenta TaxID=104341 RepID=A0A8H7NWQ3_9APHY|nr:hypothetical protein IEO21_08344 [Postia placenta]